MQKDQEGMKPNPDRRLVSQQQQQPPQQQQKCPRCESLNTKFCYYNNYSLSQPRYFCKTCRRYWTNGGTLRNVPVGGGCRKGKRAKTTTAATSTQASSSLALDNPSRSQLLVTPLGQNLVMNGSSDASTLLSTTPIISSMGAYNPVIAGGFLSSLAAIHQQSLSNQTPQLAFAHQSVNNLSANFGTSNLGQVILHGFPSVGSQQQQFYNVGIRSDTQRDQYHQLYPHEEDLIQSNTSPASSHHQQQNWTANPIVFADTSLWSTISTTATTTTTTATTTATSYSGPSLNQDPWRDDNLSGYGPPS